MEKQPDIIINKIEHGDLIISNLLYQTEHSSIRLIGNRSIDEGGEVRSTLLPELQNFAYFLVVEDEGENLDLDKMLNEVKKISGVEYSIAIEPDKLKNKDNLIF